MKKLASLILIGVLAACAAIPAAAGSTSQALKTDESTKKVCSGTFDMDDYNGAENFRYELQQEIDKSLAQEEGCTTKYASKTIGNSQISWTDCDEQYRKLLDEVREEMKAKENEITVTYHTDESDIKPSLANTFALRVMYDAMVHNGDPQAGDYLYQSNGTMKYTGYLSTREDGGTDITVSLNIVWYTSKDDEKKISTEVDRIMDSFKWTAATSDYKKISDIYGYITSTVTYDYEHVNDWYGDIKYYPMRTAYGTLIDHTAICQGVAVTIYRLMLEAGIDCRCVDGSTSGGSHAWNIVKLGGEYYNVDATWDLGKKTYKYFLQSDATFGKTHERYGSYGEEAFYLLYPMADTDYIETDNDKAADIEDAAAGYTDPCAAGHTMKKTADVPTTYTCSVCGHTEYTDGLFKASDGNWYYYKSGRKSTYTGFASNGNGKWYVENGKVTFKKQGILKDENGSIGDKNAWYYVIGSKVQTGFTGLSDFSNENGWWYIKGGQVDFTHNGVDKNCNGWWYVTGGKVQFSFTGLANYKNKNGWWYIKKGKVDFTHNGVDKNKNGWWYVTDGKVQFNFTGLGNYGNANGWWYIQNGKVDFTHNGVDKNKNGWWYITGGKVRFGYTGIGDYKNSNGWWYVKNGKVDFTANTVARNKNGWWYVSGGKVDFSHWGIDSNSNGWWVIRDGKVDFSFTGLAANENGVWYARNGKVQFGASGSRTINGITYTAKNGKVTVTNANIVSGGSGTERAAANEYACKIPANVMYKFIKSGGTVRFVDAFTCSGFEDQRYCAVTNMNRIELRNGSYATDKMLPHEFGHYASSYVTGSYSYKRCSKKASLSNIMYAEIGAYRNTFWDMDMDFVLQTSATEEEYFADAFGMYCRYPSLLKENCPRTYKYVEGVIKRY